jgi:hypothetical protein
MKDDLLEEILRAAPLESPVGGLETARERAMGRVRHHFPADSPPPKRSLWRPLGATALAGGIVVALLLIWPEPRAEADPLPTEPQMQHFYDQYELHHTEHTRQAQETR